MLKTWFDNTQITVSEDIESEIKLTLYIQCTYNVLTIYLQCTVLIVKPFSIIYFIHLFSRKVKKSV